MLTQAQIDQNKAVGAMDEHGEPRPAPAPVRLPRPPATTEGSPIANQKGMQDRFFDISVAARAMEAAK